MTKVGDRVRLNYTDDKYTTLKRGDVGTVRLIDDAGTVHVQWDNGSTLGLIADYDRWSVIPQEVPVDG